MVTMVTTAFPVSVLIRWRPSTAFADMNDDQFEMYVLSLSEIFAPKLEWRSNTPRCPMGRNLFSIETMRFSATRRRRFPIRRQPPTTRRKRFPIRRQPPTAADNAPRTPSGLSVRLDGWEELGVTDRAVVEFLFAHGRSRTSEISATTGIPDRTIRDALKRLMERDMVAAHGASRSREYGLKAM